MESFVKVVKLSPPHLCPSELLTVPLHPGPSACTF